MAQPEEVISTINDLIQTLKDGEEGFKEAAQAVKSSKLTKLFTSYSRQRSRFATELQTHAKQLGESKPETESSTAGAAHRAWINLKSVLTSGDDNAILAECERGEDLAVVDYKDALENGLSADVRAVVSRQFSEIKAAHDRVKELRDAQG